jgi:hypothetical protein
LIDSNATKVTPFRYAGLSGFRPTDNIFEHSLSSGIKIAAEFIEVASGTAACLTTLESENDGLLRIEHHV